MLRDFFGGADSGRAASGPEDVIPDLICVRLVGDCRDLIERMLKRIWIVRDVPHQT